MPIAIHTIRNRSALQRGGFFGRKKYTPVRTGRRRGTSIAQEQLFPPKPLTWRGTLPEWAIFWAHGILGLKEGEDFEYIPRLAVSTGNVKGLQVDFFEWDVNVAIDIQGLFWHYGFSAAKQFSDQETRIRVESTGATYVAIDEDDALRDPVYYLKEAREGRDHSRASRGVV